MITWAEKVAFLGMKVKTMPSSTTGPDTWSRHKVKLCYNPGLCSYGYGDTIDEAIGDAAIGMPICWSSVERKITEREWERMSHT